MVMEITEEMKLQLYDLLAKETPNLTQAEKVDLLMESVKRIASILMNVEMDIKVKYPRTDILEDIHNKEYKIEKSIEEPVVDEITEEVVIEEAVSTELEVTSNE